MIDPSAFESGPAPDGLRFWWLADPPESALFGCRVEVNVLLELLDLADLDFTLINTVVADVDRYLSAAVEFVERRLREDPAHFGLTAPPDAHRLDLPNVTFGDSGWLVHFADAPFPIADPHGLLVEFAGDTPTEVNGTVDGEEIEWT